MKTYEITIDDSAAEFYEEVAKACGHTTEDILSDTLLKIIDIISRSVSQ